MSKKFPPVKTKRDFVRRYAKGEFGNASPTWNNIEDWFLTVRPEGLYHIRNRIAGGPTFYNVPRDDVFKAWNQIVSSKAENPENLYISQMCPTEKTIFRLGQLPPPDSDVRRRRARIETAEENRPRFL